MVPDLVVLLVVEGDGVNPVELLVEVGVQGGEGCGAIEPDCIVSWVEVDNVSCKL